MFEFIYIASTDALKSEQSIHAFEIVKILPKYGCDVMETSML